MELPKHENNALALSEDLLTAFAPVDAARAAYVRTPTPESLVAYLHIQRLFFVHFPSGRAAELLGHIRGLIRRSLNLPPWVTPGKPSCDEYQPPVGDSV